MKTVIVIFVWIYFIFGVICMYRGLDLKKWYNWLIGLYGFVVFFTFMIVLGADVSNAIGIGLFFAIPPLYQGAINHWRREKNKGALAAWLENPETEKRRPWLKRLVMWFLPE